MDQTSRLIFQLGTTDWQRHGERSASSAIGHRAVHHAFNRLPGVSSYSMWPSSQAQVGRPDLRVFEIDAASVVEPSTSGETRWHAMSERAFGRYRQRLAFAIHSWMAEIEAECAVDVSLMVAHDALLSSIVLSDVAQRRATEGRPSSPILCFADSASLRLFAREREGMNTADYPYRFLPQLGDLGIFGAQSATSFGVDVCATRTEADYDAVVDLFPSLPSESVLVSRGYDQSTFAAAPGHDGDRSAHLATFMTAPSVDGRRPAETIARPTGFHGVVVSVGRSSGQDRIDALLRAAAHYELGEAVVATVIVHPGDREARAALETLAWDHLGLKNVFFIDQQSQRDLAGLLACADVGVFAATDGADQLVLECMACATPVIAIEPVSGDLVPDAVGALVPNHDDSAQLAISLGIEIAAAINERWKEVKGPAAADWVAANFSVDHQVDKLFARALRSVSVGA